MTKASELTWPLQLSRELIGTVSLSEGFRNIKIEDFSCGKEANMRVKFLDFIGKISQNFQTAFCVFCERIQSCSFILRRINSKRNYLKEGVSEHTSPAASVPCPRHRAAPSWCGSCAHASHPRGYVVPPPRPPDSAQCRPCCSETPWCLCRLLVA